MKNASFQRTYGIPLTACLALLIAGTHGASATGNALLQEDIETQVKVCQAIENIQARLKCFDQITVPKTKSSGESAPASKGQTKPDEGLGAVPDPTARPETPAASEDEFGAEGLRSRIEEKEKRSPKKLESGLIEVGQNRAGKYFFILTNGQVWRQVQADTRALVVPQDLSDVKVKISKKLLGGYILSLDKRSVRVKRIK